MTAQQKIHAIWARELKLEEFSDTDDFFALGGHSLIMTRIQQSILDELGVEVPMDQLFRKSTVQDIAAHIDSSLTVS
ncbi:phosphopantetheine-binding protein [Streptomyces sp. TRM 70351]|uniref:phosphopantetheine-binding protein n=1 Tax=Streptomyces sp. TRM 70351 TaxID=3116552 RepID=UPI002E7B0961|nr:phosphopantetheine-binding protein [Streptomyces sp. TRM 70351]MEE1927329.1 phosphopantetheine-binding protein [Streptomyces sp. TRM 70351]